MARALVGAAYVKILPSMRGFSNSINKELSQSGLTKNMSKAITNAINGVDTKSVSSKLSSLTSVAGEGFKKLGSLAADAAKKITDVTKGITAAGAAATTALGKMALDAYADNEQLVGGIETLYGENSAAAKKMAEQAANAWQTAGLSANEYMETAINSSAAMISSLGGDVDKAADLMDMAITDMSDNVNKMGTSMDSIQDAYRGFSRGNFTMLDNLALGFAGTKEGMQQLLDKAHELSGLEYNIDSYADIVQAIHVVQDEMGITGTTAREAASTIEGSTKAMKSAWSNWLTGLGQDNADMAKLTENLSKSIDTMLGNVVPRLGVIAQSLASELPNLINSVLKNAPKLITDIIPSLVQSITGVVGAIGAAIPQILEAFIPALAQGIADGLNNLSDLMESDGGQFADKLQTLITDGLNTIIPAIARFLPNLYTLGAEIILSLVQGAAQAMADNTDVIVDGVMTLANNLLDMLPDLVTSLSDIFVQVVTKLSEKLPEILPTLTSSLINVVTATLPTILQALITATTSLLQSLSQMLPTLMPQLTQGIIQLVQATVQVVLDNLPLFIESAFQIVGALLDGLAEALPVLLDALPDLITQTIDALINCLPQIIDGCILLVEKLVEHLPEIIIALVDAMPRIVEALLEAVIKAAPKLIEGGFKLIEALGEGIWQMIGKLPEIVGHINDTILTVLSELPGKLLELGGQIVQGLIDGISGAIGSVGDAIGNLGDAAVQGFCDFFGIHSPSTLFMSYGDYMMQGLAKGIDNGSKDVMGALAGVGKDIEGAGTNFKANADYQVQLNQATAAGDSQAAQNAALIDAFSNIAIYMDSTQVSKLTAGARDKVDGSRQNFVNRGLAVA